VAASPTGYLTAAVDLAGETDRLAALRTGLRQRLVSSPLCDAPAFARDLEAGYRAMWRTEQRSRRKAA
jgi:predicted O-linked N-acetylglucosamine transferase (SPINDLY family)